MNLDSFYHWLRSACPADAATLLQELGIGRKAAPDAYAGLPATAAELSEALRALEVRGLVTKEGTEWRWLPVVVKEPQKELFA